MRLDRVLTVHVFSPIVGLRGNGLRGNGLKEGVRVHVPILMYHSIAMDIDCAVHPYYRTVTTPATFARQMAQLSERGSRGVTLSEAVGLLSGTRAAHPGDSRTRGELDGGRPVAITFDDGFGDFASEAFPVLRRFGFAATVFLSTAYLGGPFVNGRECLGEDEVGALAAQGVEFGSHTMTHPQLRDISRQQVVDELAGSKERIEAITRERVRTFSYPYRFPEEDAGFVQELRGLLQRQGYDAGVTTAIGVASAGDDPLFLKRLPVNECDDRVLLEAKLAGAYDWLHTVQLSYKRLCAHARSPAQARNARQA